MQLGEREFFGKKFKGNGAVAYFGAKSFTCGSENFSVVEGEFWNLIKREPSGIDCIGVSVWGVVD